MSTDIIKKFIDNFRHRQRIIEFFRFGVVGILATALHYGMYYVLLPFFNANLAYTVGYVFSFIFNFYLSNYFTFKTIPTFRKGVGFGLSHALNYLLHVLLLNLFLWIGIPEKFAPLPVFAIVIPVNFILVRLVLKSKK